MEPDEILSIVDKHEGERGGLISILEDIQAKYSYLPAEALKLVADGTGQSLIDVYGVATFYKSFSLKPRGKHLCLVCKGTACHVRGATRVLDTVQDATGIKPGETDLDLKFSLETVNCLGCCALGPVMEVDGKTHGKMTPAESADVLKNYE